MQSRFHPTAPRLQVASPPCSLTAVGRSLTSSTAPEGRPIVAMLLSPSRLRVVKELVTAPHSLNPPGPLCCRLPRRSVQDGSVLDDGFLERLDSLIQAARAAVAETGQNTGVFTPVQEPENGPSSATEAPAQVQQSIRVESSKLDALMRLAGELLVVRGALPAFAERLEGTESAIAMPRRCGMPGPRSHGWPMICRPP